MVETFSNMESAQDQQVDLSGGLPINFCVFRDGLNPSLGSNWYIRCNITGSGMEIAPNVKIGVKGVTKTDLIIQGD